MKNNPKTSNNAPDSKLAELTIRQLISSITPVQLWAVLGATLILIVGAFGLGYNIQKWQSEAKESQLKIDFKNLGIEHQNLKTKHKQLKAKENVLRLYFLYASADSDIRYIQDRILEYWKALDLELGIRIQESPGQQAIKLESFKLLPIDKLLQIYSQVHSDYVSIVGRRELQGISGGVMHILQSYEKAIKQLSELEKRRSQAEQGLIELLDYYSEQDMDNVGYEVTLGEMSKNQTGRGIIKFAYDGTTLEIPNDFLPPISN